MAGAPDVGSSGKGTGLEEGSPLQRERAWRQPPRLQHQPAKLPPPSAPQPAPFLSGDFFSFVGRGGRGRWSTEGKEGAPALKAEVLSLQWGTALQLPPNHRSPARPGPADSPEGLSSLVFSSVVLSGWPGSQRTLPLQSRLLSEPLRRSRTHRRWGHRLAFRAASGAKPQDEVGGPPRLPRAGFSLWTLRPLPSGRSSEPTGETSGRWEGAGLPRSQDGGRKKSPLTPVGLRVGKERGSGGPGAPRPQVTREQGDQGDAGPVPAR